jgi:hypothetical protein
VCFTLSISLLILIGKATESLLLQCNKSTLSYARVFRLLSCNSAYKISFDESDALSFEADDLFGRSLRDLDVSFGKTHVMALFLAGIRLAGTRAYESVDLLHCSSNDSVALPIRISSEMDNVSEYDLNSSGTSTEGDYPVFLDRIEAGIRLAGNTGTTIYGPSSSSYA